MKKWYEFERQYYFDARILEGGCGIISLSPDKGSVLGRFTLKSAELETPTCNNLTRIIDENRLIRGRHVYSTKRPSDTNIALK